MYFLLFWFLSMGVTAVIAHQKRLHVVGFLILAWLTGPIALLIALFTPARPSAQASDQKVLSLQEAGTELASLKQSLQALQAKMGRLEEALSAFGLQPQPESTIVESAAKKEGPAAPTPKIGAQEGIELVFGKYWLNRIGVIVFVLGVAFFISFAFQYLNAAAKIAIGYLFAAAFFGWGTYLEKKELLRRLSWGILGGAWSLLYLTTYAMYYIRVTRLITSPAVALILLAGVSLAAMAYNLKYRSWTVTALTALLAFITGGLGQIEYATVVYWVMLIATLVFIAYRLRWRMFLLFGICGTYVTYAFWLRPQIVTAFLFNRQVSVPVYQFQLGFLTLAASWFLFSLPLFLWGSQNDDEERMTVAGTLLNAIFFAVMGLMECYRIKAHLSLLWDIRFWFMVALACLYCLQAYGQRIRQNPRLSVVQMAIAFTLTAVAALIRYPSTGVVFLWTLETALVFFLGLYYREVAYRIVGSMLGAVTFFRLFIVDYYSRVYYLIAPGIELKHTTAILTFAALCFLSMGIVASRRTLTGRLYPQERELYKGFSVAGAILLLFLLSKDGPLKWVSLSWGVEAVGLLCAGLLFKDRTVRICALGVFACAAGRLLLLDMSGLNTIYRIFSFVVVGAIMVAASFAYSKFFVQDQQ